MEPGRRFVPQILSFLKHTGCLSLVKTYFVSSVQIGRDGTLSFSRGTAAQLGQVRIRSSHDPCDEKQKRKKLEDCHKRAVPVERLQGALQGWGGLRGGFVV